MAALHNRGSSSSAGAVPRSRSATSSEPTREPGTPARRNRVHSSSADSTSPKSPSLTMSPQSMASPEGAAAQHDSRDKARMSVSDAAGLDFNNFTPSLHASLVSEILALRRQVESKSLSLDGLEAVLSSTRAENETLQETVSRHVRESRTVKKQLQSIEESTLAAIQGLVKERDEALEAKTGLRRRVEDLQRTHKTLQDQIKHANNQHALDKQAWETSRVNLERRVRVAEGRLEGVLQEVAAANLEQSPGSPRPVPSEKSADHSPDLRRQSADAPATPAVGTPQPINLHRRQRSSVATFNTKVGVSLADEIDFDDEAFSEGDEIEGSLPVSPSSTVSPRRVPLPRDSIDLAGSGDAARVSNRVPLAGIPVGAAAKALQVSLNATIASDADEADSTITPDVAPLQPSPFVGVAAGTQTEWPEVAPSVPATVPVALSKPVALTEPVALPVPATPPVSVAAPVPASIPLPLSPPESAAAPTHSSPQPVHATESVPATPPAPTRAPPPVPNSPAAALASSLAVQPKVQMHSFGCQTDALPEPKPVPTQSASTQTDAELPSGKRRSQLLPSAISDSMPSLLSSGGSEQDLSLAGVETPQIKTDWGSDREGGEESNWARLKRAFRNSQQMLDMSQLPPDLAALSDAEREPEDYVSQPMRSSLRSPRENRAIDVPTPVLEDAKGEAATQTQDHAYRSSVEDERRPRSKGRWRRSRSKSKSKSPRGGSPTITGLRRRSSGRPPIPPRGSSHPRANNKYRSGYDLPSPSYARTSGFRKSRAPPPIHLDQPTRGLAPSVYSGQSGPSTLHSPTTPRYPPSASNTSGRPSQSSRPYLQVYDMVQPTGSASVNSEASYSVVDAITATMIGEWMSKSVRKRRPFGGSESSQDVSKLGESRHQRWVWLSPYDRTIMWSGKQPMSNNALLGKPGRKLEIQSVLDIKDDTKDDTNEFGRSILVLTPERALKFTASSRQRHYIWLTALSFLSKENSDAVADVQADLQGDISAPFPSPADLQVAMSTTASSTRGPLNSVRTSIGKARSGISSTSAGTPTVQAFDPNLFDMSHRRQESFEVVDAALSPAVPRIPRQVAPRHSRKRSATLPARSRVVMSTPSRPPPIQTQTAFVEPLMNFASPKLSITPSETYRMEFDKFANEPNSLPGAEASGRASERVSDVTGADFGGNANFFDAGGLVRMHAFVSPGMVVATSPTTGKQWTVRAPAPPSGPNSIKGHGTHGSSNGSNDTAFSGPPPIASTRRPPVPVLGKVPAFRARFRREAATTPDDV